MAPSAQIDIPETCEAISLLGVNAIVLTNVRTLVSTSVRTNASQGFQPESAKHNMLQAQPVAVEARRSACRESRSAKRNLPMSGVTFSALGFINCPLSGN